MNAELEKQRLLRNALFKQLKEARQALVESQASHLESKNKHRAVVDRYNRLRYVAHSQRIAYKALRDGAAELQSVSEEE